MYRILHFHPVIEKLVRKMISTALNFDILLVSEAENLHYSLADAVKKKSIKFIRTSSLAKFGIFSA